MLYGFGCMLSLVTKAAYVHTAPRSITSFLIGNAKYASFAICEAKLNISVAGVDKYPFMY